MSVEKRTPRVLLSLPPDSHPHVVRGRFIERDETLLGLARGAMEAMYDVYDKINTLGTTVRDKAKLAREALPHVERVTSRVGTAIEQLGARRAALSKQLDEKIIGDGRDAMGVEIRAYLQRLAKGEAASRVTEAARAGDRRTVAAALSGPAYLVGLTPEQHTAVAGIARQTLEPDMTGLLADLDANIERVKRAHEVFVTKAATHIREWRDSDEAMIAKQLGGAR